MEKHESDLVVTCVRDGLETGGVNGDSEQGGVVECDRCRAVSDSCRDLEC